MKPEKRQRIMQAAEALFSRGRFHEIKMDEVARKAGVGKGTLYRYFKDKDDLFSEVALSGYDELCEMVRTESQRSKDFRSSLVNMCGRVAEFHRSRRQLMHMQQSAQRRALWQRGRMKEQWLEKRRRLIAAVSALLEEGRRAGKIRGDLPLDVLSAFLLGMLRTRGWSSRVDRNFRIEHEAVVDLFLNGASGETGPKAKKRRPGKRPRVVK